MLKYQQMIDELPRIYGQYIGIAGVLLELSGAVVRGKFIRKLLYGLMIVLTLPLAGFVLYRDFSVGTALFSIVAAWRVFNGVRVLRGRTNEIRLYRSVKRTTLMLIGLQAVAVVLWHAGAVLDLRSLHILYAFSLASLLVVLFLAYSTLRNLRNTHIRPSDKYTSDADLPTVSVCVPARNETEDLPKCLATVLANNYPKLEVLVLDDCSQDRTSEIIKGFAQKGVRFIRGERPREGWLAKNQAYEALAADASGELLLFMGVDVRLEPESIRSLVGTLTARKKSMISMLPQSVQRSGDASLVQPFRYWWELVLPRRLFNRPPVLPTAWMIRASKLKSLGGFRAARSSVLPEGYFARELTKHDEYSFIRSSGKLAVATAKSFSEQWDTAVRMRYPELRHRPENVLLVALGVGLLIVYPFFAGAYALGAGHWLLVLVSGLNLLALVWIHYRVTRAWHPANGLLPIIMLPVAIAVDVASLLVSMYRYEFDKVIWKDRNICIPVMQRIPRLPKI